MKIKRILLLMLAVIMLPIPVSSMNITGDSSGFPPEPPTFEDVNDLIRWIQTEDIENFQEGRYKDGIDLLRQRGELLIPSFISDTTHRQSIKVFSDCSSGEERMVIGYFYYSGAERITVLINPADMAYASLIENNLFMYFYIKYGSEFVFDELDRTTIQTMPCIHGESRPEEITCVVSEFNSGDSENGTKQVFFVKDGFEVRVIQDTATWDIKYVNDLYFNLVPIGIHDTGWYYSDIPAKEYTVYTPGQLSGLAKLVNSGTDFKGKTITLGNDIELTGYGKHYNSGKGWTPIGMYVDDGLHRIAEISAKPCGRIFKGNFDGAGHRISNLYINAPHLNCTGLFGYVGEGSVINTHMVSADITAGNYTGGIAGISSGSIKNCSVSGTINGGSYTGGVAGMLHGSIETSYAAGEVIGTHMCGGLVGGHFGSDTTSCYTANIVSGSGEIGGITGIAYGLITNCYSTGNIGSNGETGMVGGIAGTAYNVTNCYATGEIRGTSNSVGGIVGEGFAANISNCAALNSSVSGKIYVGRITQHTVFSSFRFLSENRAFDSMIVTEDGVDKVLIKGSDQVDGEDVSMEEAMTAAFWTDTMGWGDEVWSFADGRLPILAFVSEPTIIDVIPIDSTKDIIVKHITVTNTVGDCYDVAASVEKMTDDIMFLLAVYDEDMLIKVYAADSNAVIKSVSKKEIEQGKIFIWDKNLQPGIDVVTQIYNK